MFCSECGAKLPDGSQSCPECRSELSSGLQKSLKEEIKTYDMTLEASGLSRLTGFESKSFGFLILAMFFINASFLFKGIFLRISSNPLPVIFTPISALLSFALMSVFLVLHFGIEIKRIKKVLAGSIFSSIIIMSSISIFGLIISGLYKSIVQFSLNNSGPGILTSFAYFLSILLVQYLVISGLMQLYYTVRADIPPVSFAKSYLKTIKLMFKHFGFVSLLDLTIFLVLLLTTFLQKALTGIIFTLQPYGFLNVFFINMIWALILAFILQIVFNLSSIYYSDYSEAYSGISPSSPRTSLIFTALLLLPVIALFITTYKAPSNPFEKVKEEITAHEGHGDMMLQLGFSLGAIDEYDRALSKAYSARALLNSLKADASSNPQLQSIASQDFTQAEKLDVYNGYISLFRGNLYLLKDDFRNANSEFEKSQKNGLAPPETLLGLLRTNKGLGNKDRVEEIIDAVILQGVFHDSYSALYRSSLKKIDSYLDDIDDIIKRLEPKQLYKYYERVKYNDHAAALSELRKLKEAYPDDPEISYHLTLLYTEFRNEQNNYQFVISETTALSVLLSDELDAGSKTELDIFSAQMFMQANDYVKAESIYADLYKENKEEQPIAETYMELLIKNGKHEQALKLADELNAKKMKSIRLSYLSSMALLNLGDHERSLDKASEMTEYGQNYTEEYDRLLYAYSLAYVNAIKNQEHIDLIDKGLANHLLYDYVLGLKGWKDKNSDTSNIYLLKVLNNDNRLGYAMYAVGINYYEMAIRTGSNDFRKAIEYYLDSLKILPDHFEGYFALGHCYKKAGMKLEALRAFRKVVELVPYEDHRVDPYGIVVHAIGEVSTLVAELGKEAY